jgi:hypothetical protein
VGFRFRRTLRIAPGIRWNIGMRSTSVRLGNRAFGVTLGTRGNRATVSAPGTGLSYSQRVTGWLLLVLVLMACILVLIA